MNLVNLCGIPHVKEATFAIFGAFFLGAAKSFSSEIAKALMDMLKSKLGRRRSHRILVKVEICDAAEPLSKCE